MAELTGSEKVMEVYKQIGEQERHFNELEKSYRLLSSQWLLASLGAIGFLLQSDKFEEMASYKNVLIGAIGLVSNFGIFLLWMIDIRVYHKLLNCVFLQGVKLEQENTWLPRIRTDMILSQQSGDVVNSTALFYIGSCSLLLVISIISFGSYFIDNTAAVLITCLSGIGLICLQVVYMMKTSRNPRAKNLYNKLIANYKDDVI